MVHRGKLFKFLTRCTSKQLKFSIYQEIQSLGILGKERDKSTRSRWNLEIHIITMQTKITPIHPREAPK
jgi:hypothetical protein